MQIEKRYEAKIENAAVDGYDAAGILSGPSADRVNDTIDPKAYQPYVGKRLPALFSHDHEKIIGVWENLRIESSRLVGDLKLAATDLGNYVKALIAANVPLMNSIGFRAKGTKKKDGGYHFTELQLLEASVVAVGAHPDAVMIAKKFGLDIAPALNRQQRIALTRAKNILAENTREPQDTALQAFDKVVADARAYLVANESQIDPRVDIDVTFTSGGYEVCFERK